MIELEKTNLTKSDRTVNLDVARSLPVVVKFINNITNPDLALKLFLRLANVSTFKKYLEANPLVFEFSFANNVKDDFNRVRNVDATISLGLLLESILEIIDRYPGLTDDDKYDLVPMPNVGSDAKREKTHVRLSLEKRSGNNMRKILNMEIDEEVTKAARSKF